MPSQIELRKEITHRIVDALEQNHLFWRRPWSVSKNSGRAANIISKRPYSGINVLLTGLHAMKHGFTSRWWGTYDQIKSLGSQVKSRPANVERGQWGCRVVFYRPITKTVTDKTTGEEKEEQFPLLKSYTIFNVDQCEGLDHLKVTEPTGTEVPDFGPAEDLLAATGADIRFCGDSAFYRRPTPEGTWPNHADGDYIQMPHRSRFETTGAYVETALHELSHWSELRTGWDHQKHGYAMGELVAELTACFLSQELGVPQGEGIENHAAYLRSWLEAMKADPSFIFKASSEASKRTDYLLAFVPAEGKQVVIAA